jgi:hypothetical protein
MGHIPAGNVDCGRAKPGLSANDRIVITSPSSGISIARALPIVAKANEKERETQSDYTCQLTASEGLFSPIKDSYSLAK